MIFSLSCSGGAIKACVTYFVSGGCPGGAAQSCCSDSGGLTLADDTCDPFHMHLAVSPAGCPALTDNGISSIYWDDPGPVTHCPVLCYPCPVPRTDLRITVLNSGVPVTTHVLTWRPAYGFWQYCDDYPICNSFNYTFFCSTDPLATQFTLHFGEDIEVGDASDISHTCSPLHAVFQNPYHPERTYSVDYP